MLRWGSIFNPNSGQSVKTKIWSTWTDRQIFLRFASSIRDMSAELGKIGSSTDKKYIQTNKQTPEEQRLQRPLCSSEGRSTWMILSSTVSLHVCQFTACQLKNIRMESSGYSMSPGATLQVSSIPTTPSFLTEYMISCKIFNYGANVRNSWSSREQVAIFLIILSSPERLREIKEVVAIFRISPFNLKVEELIWNTNIKDQALKNVTNAKLVENTHCFVK